MRLRLVLGLAVVAVAVLVAPGLSARPAAAVADVVPADDDKKPVAEVSFKTDVMPILATNCVNCHGGKKKKGGVDLESYAGVMKTIQAGKPDQSKLCKALVGKGAKQMPPKSSLDDKEIELIRAWVAAGAKNN